jgi:hypothetical protein
MRTILYLIRILLPSVLLYGFVLTVFRSNDHLLLIILCVGAPFFLIGLRGNINFFRQYFAIRKWEYRDVSDEVRLYPMPEGIYAELGKLGFERLGEIEVKVPARPLMTEWVFTNSEGTIQAGLIFLNAKNTLKQMVQFSSNFAENNVVETSFPIGEDIETPSFRSALNHESVQAAYDIHRLEMGAFHRRYGQPNVLKTINEVLFWNDAYIKSGYAHRKQRYYLLYNTFSVVWIFYVTFVALFTYFIVKFAARPIPWGLLGVLIVLDIIGVLVMIVAIGFRARFIWMGLRLTRMASTASAK